MISLTTLAVFAGPIGAPAWQANVIATAVATVPSYVLNRRWVWGRSGSSHWWREVVPFWSLSFGGLVLSTIAVHQADHMAGTAGWVGTGRTLALLSANIGAFGLLWIGQFVLLDRVLFRHPSHDERRAVPA